MEWVKMKINFNQTVRKLEMALGLFIGAVKSAASKRSADGLTAVPWIQTGNELGPSHSSSWHTKVLVMILPGA